MKNDSMLLIDKGYNLLEELTDKQLAKELFKKYLSQDVIDNDINKVKLDIAFKEISRKEIISQIAKHALTYAFLDGDVPLKDNCIRFKDNLLSFQIEHDKVVEYLMVNKDELRRIIDAFIEQRYNKKNQHKIITYVNNVEINKYIDCLDSCGKSDYKSSLIGRVKNFILNKSRLDILENNQFKIDHKKYSLGQELYACIDRGNQYLSQEDALLIDNHPDLKDFKMIAVADGDSSKNYGERASNLALNYLLKWFEGLDPNYFYKLDKLRSKLIYELKIINSKLFDNNLSSTIAVAIVGNSKTLISTIGDTRIYLIKDNKVVDETKDDSYVQVLCDKGLADPAKARFHKAKGFVNETLGNIQYDSIIPNNTYVINSDYDKLLVLSDGVTKLIGNDKLEDILLNNRDEDVTEMLVNVAKTEDDYLKGIDRWCNNVNQAGQENVTAAMYVKRR